MDDGVDDERVATQSGDVGRMVSLIKSDRGVRPAKERGDGRLSDACLSVAYLVLALGVDGVGSFKDHKAFLRVREAIIILARRASFLGRLLLALPFLWLASLSQKVLEELVVLIEVLYGVGMVGAWTLHELVKVVGLALLGLLAHMIGCGDQSWVGRSTPILLILLAPLCGGALALVLTLGLAPIPTAAEDRLDHLLARGVVCGDVK